MEQIKEKTISLRITEDLYEKLKAFKEEFGVSHSSLAGWLLEVYFYADVFDDEKFKEFYRNSEAVFSQIEIDISRFRRLATSYRKMSMFLDDVHYAFNKVIDQKKEFENEIRREKE